MKKVLKNIQMAEMLRQLKPLLSRRDMIGYVAARNLRTLSDALSEYVMFRDGLIEKYGEPEPDSPGLFALRTDSPKFPQFLEEIKPFDETEHEVELMSVKYDPAAGGLSGEEILAVDWMLEE